MLLRYCRHTARAGMLDALLGKADPAADLLAFTRLAAAAREETRLALGLARSLRLTVQARVHPATAGRAAAAAAPVQSVDAILRGRHGN